MNSKLTRREALTLGVAAIAATRIPSASAADQKPAAGMTPLVFDALGEIRTVYTPELVDEILASGTRAISITLTDPKAPVEEAFDLLLPDLAEYNRYFRKHASHYLKANKVADVDRARREGKLAVFYNLQDSNPIERDLNRVALLRELGITAIQLTYNSQNFSGAGCFVEPNPGITPFGRELIERMAREKVLLDLSHAGMRTMSEAIAASPNPVIISHTACKALRPHRRNTTDENMRAVAERGGVIGITQIRTFLTDAKTDNLEVYFDHIVHAVKVAGIEHIGIGSDRDHRVIPDTEEELKILLAEEGSQIKPTDWPLYLEKLNGPRRMEVVRDGLRRRKFTPSDIDRIMGGNVYRLYSQVIG